MLQRADRRSRRRPRVRGAALPLQASQRRQRRPRAHNARSGQRARKSRSVRSPALHASSPIAWRSSRPRPMRRAPTRWCPHRPLSGRDNQAPSRPECQAQQPPDRNSLQESPPAPHRARQPARPTRRRARCPDRRRETPRADHRRSCQRLHSLAFVGAVQPHQRCQARSRRRVD